MTHLESIPARRVLTGRGLPEDIVDKVLSLHTRELAAVLLREADDLHQTIPGVVQGLRIGAAVINPAQADQPAAGPAPDRSAMLAEDLRYVLTYRGPGHAHDRPGVWDTSGKPCQHCARLTVARRNLAAYDADSAADQ